MTIETLHDVASAIVSRSKGILAADESTPTIGKRFDAVGADSSEASRRRYREILFTTPDLERHIGGVILFDETLRQTSQRGVPFPTLLATRGIVPGIKVDRGAKSLALRGGETVTEGLDGLRERLAEYRELGARFAKWRAVIEIDASDRPTEGALRANAHALARYAALCQEANLVPIVEPEVLMDGDHTLARCEAVTARTLRAVFNALAEQNVLLEGILLKPNMVIAGKRCPEQASVEDVAAASLRCLRRTVPAAVPGIAFLSGGQSAVDATDHLNAMNARGPAPWPLSFSYGRALQAPVLEAWGGHEERAAAAQDALFRRSQLNSLAREGRYSRAMEGH